MSAEVFENEDFTMVTWSKHNENGMLEHYEITITKNIL